MDDPQLGSNPMDQFSMLSVIGKGSYAKVILVRKKSDGKLYALKSMKKKYIEKKKQQKRVMLQKQILKQIKHPFLVQMNCSFQTDTKLFLVLEYCPGGQLFGLLSKRKRLTQQQARFYIAQVILALEYLHSKGIIYRDLKPENILLDAVGYVKLTDFGLSKNNIVGDKDAFSVCGTPQYLPPEVLKKQGHGKAVDYWCLGSLMYELIYGLPPFYSKNRNDLFEKIKTQQPYFAKSWSDNIKSLMKILFEKNPQARMAACQNIKNHPWFETIDWNKLLNKEYQAPFVPKIENQQDIRNFDKQFTECMVESPLESYEEGKKLVGFSYQKSPVEKVQKKEQSQMIQQFQMEIS